MRWYSKGGGVDGSEENHFTAETPNVWFWPPPPCGLPRLRVRLSSHSLPEAPTLALWGIFLIVTKSHRGNSTPLPEVNQLASCHIKKKSAIPYLSGPRYGSAHKPLIQSLHG